MGRLIGAGGAGGAGEAEHWPCGRPILPATPRIVTRDTVSRMLGRMPCRAAIKPNFYKDSVALMRISQRLLEGPGLRRASLLMGTAANKEILAQAGLLEAALDTAQPADLMIVLEADEITAVEAALARVEALLAGERPAASSSGSPEIAARSIAMALERSPEANLVQISVPGPYAAAEALKALRRGLHVFLFSDNVPLAEERVLKDLAARKGLLVMGPDCGTAILAGVPLGFANAVRRGAIGLVGASGTGLQQVATRIHALGEGVSHAIGTGSRDVSAEVGGATMLAGLALLARDQATRVIVIVSKPPAPAVMEHTLASARQCGKPVVVLFLGAQVASGGNLHVARTLDEAAAIAVALLRGRPCAAETDEDLPELVQARGKLAPSQRHLRALYSGGTFCAEAQLAWRDAGLSVWSNAPLAPERALAPLAPSREHTAIDLGADEFTVGRPHPMIDQSLRIERLAAEARDPSVAAIVLDIVLGYGAHADPAGALAPAIRAAREVASAEGRHLVVIAFVCGTEEDPQPLSAQQGALAAAGALVVSGSSAAARAAARLVSA